MKFEELNLHQDILREITDAGFTEGITKEGISILFDYKYTYSDIPDFL